MLLHIIKHSPFHSSAFEQCISISSQGDGILFIADGIYCLNWDQDKLKNIAESYTLYILTADAETRGLTNFPRYITPINYDGFVDLTLAFSSSISW